MTQTADRNDPFLTFRFEVTLDNLPVGGFSDCSGLQLETEVQDYAEGGLNTHTRKFPTRTKQMNLTLKRGIVDSKMWEWYFELTRGKIRHRNVTIAVKDSSGVNVVMEWQFYDAFPVKWIGPELNALQNQVAVESMELCYQGLERKK